jgi:hypothetical protein
MPYILSILLAVFMTIQSAGGLLIERLYRDNAWVTSAWQGNDLVTLVAAVPILLAALILSRRGSIRAQMIWLGALYYGLYNDMYYLFGSAFNPFFLIYVTIAVLSTFALVSGLTGVDIDSIRRAISAKTPRRLVSGWMFLFAVTLGVLWIGQCFQYGMTGQVPQLITDTGGPTHLVAALDLWMIVPPVLLAGVWLWKRRPWGHLLSAAILVQGTLTTLGLIVAAPFQNAAGIAGAWDLVPLWSVIGAGCLTSSVLLLCSLVPIRFFRSRPGGP